MASLRPLRPLSFSIGLALVAALAYGAAVCLEWLVPAVAAHRPFTIATVLVFSLTTAGVFALALPVARDDDKAKLTQYALVATFARLAIGIGLVVAYRYLAAPPDVSYVYTFMLAYAILTAYETYALVRLSYATAPPRPTAPPRA